MEKIKQLNEAVSINNLLDYNIIKLSQEVDKFIVEQMRKINKLKENKKVS